MLMGLPPFYSDNRKLLYQKILHEKLKLPKEFNQVLVDFLEGLLQKDPKKRLGCKSSKGSDEIKYHKWFANIDWKSLINKEIKPPFKPLLKSEFDTSYFDVVEYISKFNFK
jgi:serum/glucocorticoid-regulated kinase 2